MWIVLNLTRIIFLLCSISTALGLKCYECFGRLEPDCKRDNLPQKFIRTCGADSRDTDMAELEANTRWVCITLETAASNIHSTDRSCFAKPSGRKDLCDVARKNQPEITACSICKKDLCNKGRPGTEKSSEKPPEEKEGKIVVSSSMKPWAFSPVVLIFLTILLNRDQMCK